LPAGSNSWNTIKDSNNIDMFRIREMEPAPSHAPNGDNQSMARAAGTPEVLLRSTPEKLEEKEIRAAIQQHNFYDNKRNPKGAFQNGSVDNRNDTITGKRTGLTWEKKGSWRRVGKKRADKYIEDLNQQKFGGRSDWRQPTVAELASLLEESNAKGNWLYIDPVFGDPAGDWIDICWTSDKKTPSYSNQFGAWCCVCRQQNRCRFFQATHRAAVCVQR
jgi:hypothetical protein